MLGPPTSSQREVNCIFTKALIPFVEREVGPRGVEAVLRVAGRPREWLIADHNWISLALADALAHLAMELMGETDEESWARRYGEFFMDWKPSRDERHYLGTYTIGMGSPRAIYERSETLHEHLGHAFRVEFLHVGRRHATLRRVPAAGVSIPRWLCVWHRTIFERYPTNWGLPRAAIAEQACAARGDRACEWDVRWRDLPLGGRFWIPAAVGAMLGGLIAATPYSWLGAASAILFPVAAGVATGAALVQRHHRVRTRQLLELQAAEILHSNEQLERKFRELEGKIEQLSLLTDLSVTVNATLDIEKIYEQALHRLVHGMHCGAAYLFRVEPSRGMVRGDRVAAAGPRPATRPERLEFPLTAEGSAIGRVAMTGMTVVVDDVDDPGERADLAAVRSLGLQSLIAAPLRVKDRIFGVLAIGSDERHRFAESDVELVSAVASHVALAVDRAESFQTIEELSRGLEEKIRVRTEQLRSANEELRAAYRELQATQMQLIQREKMASVGQLVAGVAHELNNPIGFVFSNVATLEDFVRRLRAMLYVYRALPLPEPERARVEVEWEARRIDYVLRYLDSMTEGIKEGAERARKIVRDLRVFARGEDHVWQPVDLHEEIESSLTLLNHLLKDRIRVERRFGDLPPVECVRSQIDQVFLNLLANAAQAIGREGSITIETRREDGTAVVAISDTGPGIPREIIGRIFDPFFTTKPVGEGTGLGLSISYEIVKRHGGEICGESLPTGGARLTLRLPLARG